MNLIEFLEYFLPFNWIGNSRIISNQFWTNPFSGNLTPPYSLSGIEQIKFELVFIEFFEYFLPLQINQIVNYLIEWISNEFQWCSSTIHMTLTKWAEVRLLASEDPLQYRTPPNFTEKRKTKTNSNLAPPLVYMGSILQRPYFCHVIRSIHEKI